MTSDNKIAIVIPTFNRKEITKKCVKGLLANTYTNFTITICDSGSTDGTREELAQFDKVTVINVGSESWWSAAVNRGLKNILKNDFDYILIINDDINFPDNLVESLLQKAQSFPHKIISPAQSNIRGIFLGIRFLGPSKKHTKVMLTEEIKTEVKVKSTNGCCLFIPVETFKLAGLFDEKNCPHLFGDIEFQVRADHVGIETMAFPDIVIGQQADTEYFRRLELRTLLTFPASPVHFRSYAVFGKTLFKGWVNFLFMGYRYHYAYLLSLVKTTLIVLKKIITNKSKLLLSKKPSHL